MKAILSLTATLISVLCLAQDYISIPYSTSITAKVPVQYSFYNGTATVKKTADVELVIENFRAHHSPINSFADGGLAGGFKCDIVFNTWFSYSEVAGLTIDNEFVPFDKLGIKELNFTVNDVRFRWIQGVHGAYKFFNMGSPMLPAKPKGEKPGYTGAIYLQLKEMIGDHGSCAEDIKVVKGKGAIYGNGLEIGGVSFTPPSELKKYLREKAENEVRLKKEEEERSKRLYNSSNNNSGLVLTKESTSSGNNSSNTTTGSSNKNSTNGKSNNSSGSNSSSSTKKHVTDGMSPQEKLAYLKKEAKRLEEEFGKYRKEKPKEKTLEDHYKEAKAAHDANIARITREQKEKEEERNKINQRRTKIIDEFPVMLTEPKIYTVRGAQKIYCFIYTNPGITYGGKLDYKPGGETHNMAVSNVFSIISEGDRINGALIREDIELSVNRQLAINNGEDERYHDYDGTKKFIAGPYASEEEAQKAVSQFKSRLRSEGVTIYDLQFTHNSGNVREHYKTALNYFEKKDFKNALLHFKRTSKELSSDPTLFVYMGRCLFQIKPRVETEMNSEITGYLNKAIQLGADAEDYFHIAGIFYGFKFNNCREYTFEAVRYFTKSAEMGNEKAIQWLKANNKEAGEVLIFYDKMNNKYGITDLDNQVVAEAEYDHIRYFSEGNYVVTKDKMMGILDRKGNTVLPPAYKYIGGIENGPALIQTIDRNGFINSAGEFVVELMYPKAHMFSEGLAGVCTYTSDSYPIVSKWGFIDSTGKEVIPMKFEDVGSFSEGLAAACISVKGKRKWGYINKKGEFVFPPEYDSVKAFRGGRAIVNIKRKYYYLDKAGNKTRL